MCRPCYEKVLRARNSAFKDRQQANARRWHARNPERKRALDAAYHATHPYRKYGLLIADYDRLRSVQGGVCAICRERDVHRLAVDHDHVTGKVRGLLCVKCNCGLGNFRDRKDLMLAAISYLEPHPAASSGGK